MDIVPRTMKVQSAVHALGLGTDGRLARTCSRQVRVLGLWRRRRRRYKRIQCRSRRRWGPPWQLASVGTNGRDSWRVRSKVFGNASRIALQKRVNTGRLWHLLWRSRLCCLAFGKCGCRLRRGRCGARRRTRGSASAARARSHFLRTAPCLLQRLSHVQCKM